jgi:hypothetical protein
VKLLSRGILGAALFPPPHPRHGAPASLEGLILGWSWAIVRQLTPLLKCNRSFAESKRSGIGKSLLGRTRFGVVEEN